MSDIGSEAEILTEARGHVGVITLNRAKALNALSHGMIRSIREALDEWEGDPRIDHVVLRSSSEKAFCAGGDIRLIYEMGVAGDPAQTAFFADEYRLNARIKHYPKPIVSLIDGIVMGGGVGLSVHGRFRVGGAKTIFAMPEVGIGFFPDVGGSFFLPRLRTFATGLYCALVGARLKQADALWAGVLTHCAHGDQFDLIVEALAQGAAAEDVVARFAIDPGEPPLAAEAKTLEACFSGDGVETVLARLDAHSGDDSEWAQEQAAVIRTRSPTSLKVAFRELREGAALEFDDCMVMEFRILSRILQGHDFYEGVRAVLIDKDNRPAWQPARLEDVETVAIDAHFMPPQNGDLPLV